MTTKTAITLAIAMTAALAGCELEHDSWAQRGLSRPAKTLAETCRPSPAPPASEAKVEAAPVAVTKVSQPAAAPTEPIAEPEADIDADLRIKRLVIAHGVQSREPVQPATSFGKGEAERIYAFLEVDNRERVHSEVYVSFVREGKPDNGGVRLRVGASPRWRTWAFTRLANKEGTWHAVVRNGKGDELARTKFEIMAAEATPVDAKATS